jgi:hypothetical protein
MATLEGLLGLGGMAASAYLPYEQSGQQIDYLKSQIPGYITQAQDITNRAVQEAQFTPFTVKTGTGTTSVGAGGAIDQTLGAQGQAIQSGLLGQAQTGAGMAVNAAPYQTLSQQALGNVGGMLGQATPTAADLYSQMQAAQAPEIQRQQLALENRLAAQGRLGVGTAAYGGTPEALAMQKAIQAQQLAPQLGAQNIANAASMFGLGTQAAASPAQLQAQNLANTTAALQAGYMPQQQQLATLTAASPFSQLATSAALSRAEQLSSGGQYGLEALVGGNANIANLEGMRTQALANTLAGMFAASATQPSTAQTIIDLFNK